MRVTAPALVTTRELADGASLEGAVRLEEREVTPGRAWLAHLPEGATAARALPVNTALDEALLRLGPRPGEPVAIVMRAGRRAWSGKAAPSPAAAGGPAPCCPPGSASRAPGTRRAHRGGVAMKRQRDVAHTPAPAGAALRRPTRRAAARLALLALVALHAAGCGGSTHIDKYVPKRRAYEETAAESRADAAPSPKAASGATAGRRRCSTPTPARSASTTWWW